MKKQVLLSVFAAALFAAPAVSAKELASYNNNVEKEEANSSFFFGEGQYELAPGVERDLRASMLESSKAKTAAANGVKVEDYKNRFEEGKLVGKGKAAAANKMAPKAGVKPAGKVLPKTSAAK